MADAIEKGARTIVAPSSFRRLFLLDRILPAQTETSLCREGRGAVAVFSERRGTAGR
jgi:hypothetical protein